MTRKPRESGLVPPHAVAAGLLLAAVSAVVPGCTPVVANLPLVGEPAGIPPRLDNPPDFPSVHETPVKRDVKPMTEDERKKLEADLVATRDRLSAEGERIQAKNRLRGYLPKTAKGPPKAPGKGPATPAKKSVSANPQDPPPTRNP